MPKMYKRSASSRNRLLEFVKDYPQCGITVEQVKSANREELRGLIAKVRSILDGKK